MTYTVKVQINEFAKLEVSGDDIPYVVKLVNEMTRKFFSHLPASKIDI